MNQFFSILSWLFGTRPGVLTLVIGGALFFVIVAFVLELRTRKLYPNHEKSPDDWSFFDSDD